MLLKVANTRFSKSALDANRSLIGENTCLTTLQNGAGDETLLRQYADDAHIVIGTTEDKGTVLGLAKAQCGDGKRKVASFDPPAGMKKRTFPWKSADIPGITCG